jgi:FtsH-binding integral membrane protein
VRWDTKVRWGSWFGSGGALSLLGISPIIWLYGLANFGVAIAAVILGFSGAVVNQKFPRLRGRYLGGSLMIIAGISVIISVHTNPNFNVVPLCFGALLIFGGILAPIQKVAEKKVTTKLPLAG